MSEEKKQRLKEYQKKYCTAKENCSKSCYAKNKEAMKEKNQESVITTCHKKKKTRLKSTKEKRTKNWFNIKNKC